ncbi:MAG: DinB family protein, partial [Gemmatimonadota bacterium]
SRLSSLVSRLSSLVSRLSLSSGMKHPIHSLLLRDLAALRRELEAYPDERQIWALPPGLPNSAGTLTLHLAGNLQSFIGTAFGKTGYVRNRPAEFSRRDVSRSELLAQIDATVSAINAAFARLTSEQLAADFPDVLNGYRYNAEDFLIHLAVHLGFHLGQIDYHRRVVTGDPAPARVMAMTEMMSARRVEG